MNAEPTNDRRVATTPTGPSRPRRGVVFDLDGVIVDTEPLWEESWRLCCADHDYTWNSADTARVQGMSSREWSAEIARLLDGRLPADEVNRRCVDHLVAAVAAGRGPLLDGARELVTEVAARVPIALASSAPRRGIEGVLDRHGLRGAFGAIISSDEVPAGKPSPDVYVAAARGIGLDPAEGFAVEDSSNGIRAAAGAGLAVIALPNPVFPPSPDALALADHVASDHADARAYILARLGPTGAVPAHTTPAHPAPVHTAPAHPAPAGPTSRQGRS